jgi:hypothetical protein
MILKPYQERAKNCCINKHVRDANGEREDERFSKDAVLEYCRNNFNMEFDVEISPKVLLPDGTKLNPDYFLYPKTQGFVDKQKVVLEVRQSGTGFIMNDNTQQGDMVYGKNVKERCEWEAVIFNWLIRLQKLIAEWALSDQTILLEIDIATVRINDTLLYSLNEKIKEIFFDNAEVGIQQEIQVENEIFYVASTKYYAGMIEYSPLKAIYGLNLYSSCLAIENDWWLQVYHILKNSIEEKEEKYKKVQDCKKWLVILNKHPLLIQNDYCEVFRDMDPENFSNTHTFDKIFIVCGKQAYPLYERM